MKTYSVLPEATIIVGDSINDIEAGRGAGVVTVACDFGYGSEVEFAEADYRIAGFTELLGLDLLLHPP